ncbi:MAG: dihydrodipicolinate synthase family protein, partial [Clostridia bacterium]
GEVDDISLQQLVEFLSRHVNGVFICGSYGCGALMSLEERKHVAEVVRKYAGKGVQVIVHTGTTTTRDTIELSKHAAAIGCDAAAAVGPYYFQYTDSDLIRYYTDILKETRDFPFYIYHNPKFQGYSTSMKVMHTLKDAGLSGIKDATFDILQYATYARELADENFDIALGTEAMWASAFVLGCDAYIPGIGNVFPELCQKMYRQSVSGDLLGSRATQFEVNRIREVMYLARSTQLAIYAIADILGIIKAYPRAPFMVASQEEQTHLKRALQGIGVI